MKAEENGCESYYRCWISYGYRLLWLLGHQGYQEKWRVSGSASLKTVGFHEISLRRSG